MRWIGHRQIDCERHPDPDLVTPIRIVAGAFGPGRPARDLLLSPDHAVADGDVLIPIKLLLNGASIWRETGRRQVGYFYIELDHHDILLAEGLGAESYLDTGNRTMFDIEGQPVVLHPDFTTGQYGRETRSCAPFEDRPAQVEPVWRALAERAIAMGWSLPKKPVLEDDPDLHIVIRTRRIKPAVIKGGHYTFVIPPGDTPVRLGSRSARPRDVWPWVADDRILGVRIRRLTLRSGHNVRDFAMDDPTLDQGWWETEWDDRVPCRWTQGNAILPPLDAGVLNIELVGTMSYSTEGTTTTDGESSEAAAA